MSDSFVFINAGENKNGYNNNITENKTVWLIMMM